ncbi:SDR family NAD(P)-dependent oxidoreductase [Microbispora sp. RL4-1S]|uniref:SDR family NAD(P)-dependent oxidoreductase n=1 Tax=Microbispora oryzae TaxID=2806554 RepID=A0A940WE74_9ACTN|nr:type I polyketide synthase [Microbispora oryzae]MBP2702998.1 SDR family NAD(P)-dependent oxidoreductase [Microbispora oryzae]
MADGIAIVGAGCRYPDASSPDRLWELVMARRRAFRPIPAARLNLADYGGDDQDSTYVRYAALLEGWSFDRARHRVPGTTFRVTDPAHWLALDVAADTLAAAGFADGGGLNRDRAGVVLGNTLTGEFTRAGTMRLRWPYVRRVLQQALGGEDIPDDVRDRLIERSEGLFKAPFPEPTDESLAGALSNTISGRICNHFDLHGGGFTVDGACASSLLAVIHACAALTSGDLDFALAGGVDLSLDPFELVGFARTGALARTDMRVYDASPTGFWPGEGCGMVALMRADDALATGRRPLAVIRGWGMSSDGRGGISRPEADGQALALRRAYQRAGFGPETVGYFEGHGTGTPVGDEAELRAMRAVRGEHRRPAFVGSVKANIGHTKAAAGAAGLIKAALAVHHQIIPPTTGSRTPHELLGGGLATAERPIPWPAGPVRAAVSAMGFGGINTHLVIEAAEPVRRGRLSAVQERMARAPLEEEVFAVTAGTSGELAGKLRRIAELAGSMSFAELTDLAAGLAGEPPGAERVAFTARDPEQLARRAGRAVSMAGRDAAESGIFSGTGPARRIGLMFTGQGGPARGDAGALGRMFDEARPYFTGPEGTDTGIVQPAVFRASMAALRWLDSLGVTASAALGHSVGEIAALTWAGAVDEDSALDLVVERGRIMEEVGAAGTGMVSVAAPAGRVAALIDGLDLVVAADNGASTVVAGPLTSLETALGRAGAAGLPATRLQVSHAFHSPAVRESVAPFTVCLDKTPFGAPVGRVFSTVTGEELDASADLRRHLAEQITRPVRFGRALELLAAECDLLVEVGPGRSLAGLAAAHLATAHLATAHLASAHLDGHPGAEPPARPAPPAVSVNAGERTGHDLLETAAALFAAGAADSLQPLFGHRFHRPYDLNREPAFLTNPCETAPEPEPVRRPAPERRQGGGAAGAVRDLVAAALELEPDAIGDDDRLLADLHMNSLQVIQLAVESASACGKALPAELPRMAEATVGDLIAAVEAFPPAREREPDRPEWFRLFAEHRRPARPPAPESPPESPRGNAPENALEAHLPAVPTDADVAALIAAARRAIGAGRPLVVTDEADCASGFVAALRQEHPELDAHWFGVDHGGRTYAVHHLPLPPARGEAPLRRGDVVLITGGGKGIGLHAGLTLAGEYGVRLALLGRSDPAADPELAGGLERLRAAGVVAAYRCADVTDADAVRRAVTELAELPELGPIAGVVHAAGVNRPARFGELTEDDFAEHARVKCEGLTNVLAAVDTGRLRLVLAYGSVIGRFGLAGEAHYALANGRLQALVRGLAGELPADCVTATLAWTAWTGAGMAERLGVVGHLAGAGIGTLPVDRGAELLLEAIAARPAGETIVVSGRLPQLDRAEDARPRRSLLHRVLSYVPGVELTAECELDPASGYLADHRLDGVRLLPAVCALEVMAQAADLLGTPARAITDARFDRPVIVPAEATRTLRIHAIRQPGGAVDVDIRSAETDFGAVHFAGRVVAATAGPPDVAVPAGDPPAHSAADLYGPLFFHGPAFRRLTRFESLLPTRCRAVLSATADDLGIGTPVLGDAALHDAAIHVLQACVPHRRLLPVGCDRFESHGDPAGSTEVIMEAVERSQHGTEYVYDVVARSADGRPVFSWTGLRLLDTGPLRMDAMPPLLTGPYLERVVGALCPGASAVTDEWLELGEPPIAPEPEWARQAEQLARLTGEPRAVLDSRMRTAHRCLAGASRAVPLQVEAAYEHGWIKLTGPSGLAVLSGLLTLNSSDGPPRSMVVAVLTQETR